MKWKLPAADTFFQPFLSEEGYKIADLKDALKQCVRFRTAVDGGAHIGTWAATMAQRFEKVIAFEPALDTYLCLVDNVRSCSNVVTVQSALGASAGFVAIRDDENRRGNTGAREVVLGVGDIPIVPLDSLGLADLDFLKLDVETHEFQALNGASETINRCAPLILIEVKKKHDWHNFIITHAKEMPVFELKSTFGGKVACTAIPTLQSFAGGQVWSRRGFNVIGMWKPERGAINKTTGLPFAENEAMVKGCRA